MIKVKKAPVAPSVKVVVPRKVDKAIFPAKAAILIKVVSSTKPVKTVISVKAAKPVAPAKVYLKHKDLIAKLAKTQVGRVTKKVDSIKTAKTKVAPEPVFPSKSITPTEVYPPHEIIKSNLSIEEDIITNPQDYETQTFDFDLSCPHGHFWRAGKILPVSNGKAYCPKCGERLRKPQSKKQRRFHRY